MKRQPASTLIFTWGNPSRGDDALGPRIYDRLLQQPVVDIDLLTDFQLQIEHAVDLENRRRVLFVDASTSATPPYVFYRLQARQDASYSTHAVSPQSLLAIYEKINHQPAPPAYMLSVRGYHFDLGAELSNTASDNLIQATSFIAELVDKTTADWNRLITATYS
jgi:hydrogenase maturation protease